ncbi:MAG: hypothetical protein ACKOJG_00810 [Actinomycetota bacterium]|jgi:hypothetical protein
MMSGSMHTTLPALNTAEFAAVARMIAAESRRLGLVAPGFRCPPRIIGVDRTVRRFAGDDAAGVVAVAVKGRPLAAVVADMIEGVVVLNRLDAADAARVRSALWLTLETSAHGVAARDASASGSHVA